MIKPPLSPMHRSALILVALVISSAAAMAQSNSIRVSVNRPRVERGQTIEITIEAQRQAANAPLRAALLKPGAGAETLSLSAVAGRPGIYRSEISIAAGAPAGLYVIHAWTGELKHPSDVGKATFRVGNIIADFLIVSSLDPQRPAADLGNYWRDLRSVGGNLLIAHNLITATKAHYASSICRTDVTLGAANDLVELLLDSADREGSSVLLSVSWDMTRQSHFKDRLKEIKAIIAELYALYRHHPSLAGFYSYQEGSGTYFAAYAREFSEHVKGFDTGLLTACAPHVDDPLLAGYLSVISELDMVIYQSGVMASYRPDNRKKYPLRRVKDFCALGAGAKRLQNKIALTHVEMFAYLEQRQTPDLVTASPPDIYQQILSAATVTDTDGIALFSYHSHIYESSKRFQQVERSRAAVEAGLKAHELITSRVSKRRQALSLYIPYSDWIVERWPNYFLPALDAFRALGTPIDVLPYAPPLAESVYPYYPFHHNEDVLRRLLAEKTVLVLTNVSGFQQTDSDLIKAFVAGGGVIIAFGEQIPMGRSYERSALFGGEEDGLQAHTSIMVKEAIGKRVPALTRFAIRTAPLPRWRSTGAKVVAAFEDGSAMMLTNRFGKGTAVTILPDATTAIESAPALVREAINYAIKAAGVEPDTGPAIEIDGAHQNTDVAASVEAGGRRIVLVNHNEAALEIRLRPSPAVANGPFEWIDLVSGQRLAPAGAAQTLRLRIPGRGFRLVEWRRSERR